MTNTAPMSMAATNESHRANIVRFGLMAIPPLAWAVAFAPLYLLAAGLHLDWVNLALVPSLVQAVVVGIACAIVWYAYKKLVVHMV